MAPGRRTTSTYGRNDCAVQLNNTSFERVWGKAMNVIIDVSGLGFLSRVEYGDGLGDWKFMAMSSLAPFDAPCTRNSWANGSMTSAIERRIVVSPSHSTLVSLWKFDIRLAMKFMFPTITLRTWIIASKTKCSL